MKKLTVKKTAVYLCVLFLAVMDATSFSEIITYLDIGTAAAVLSGIVFSSAVNGLTVFLAVLHKKLITVYSADDDGQRKIRLKKARKVLAVIIAVLVAEMIAGGCIIAYNRAAGYYDEALSLLMKDIFVTVSPVFSPICAYALLMSYGN